MLDLDISIATHNNKEILRQCLLSIYQNTKKINFSIWVIDNATTDNTRQMLKREFPEVRVIYNQKPHGFAQNQNLVLKLITARYVAVLNDDTLILPNCFDVMVEFMDKNKEIGILGPKILNPDKSIQPSCRSFPNIFMGIFRGTPLEWLFPNNPYVRQYLMLDFDHQKITEVDWISGACMLIRSDILLKVGLFDEQFFMFVEDIDLCYRLKEKGLKRVYFPYAQLIHFGSVSTSKQAVKMIIEHHKSMYKFYLKHHMRGGRLKYIIIGGLICRALLAIGHNRYNYLVAKLRKKNE